MLQGKEELKNHSITQCQKSPVFYHIFMGIPFYNKVNDYHSAAAEFLYKDHCDIYSY